MTNNKEQEKLKKVRVKEILDAFGKLINKEDVQNEKGLLDFEKLEKNEVFKEMIKKLKELDVDSKYLAKNFFTAHMIIGGYF